MGDQHWENFHLEVSKPIVRLDVINQATTGGDCRAVKPTELFTPIVVELMDVFDGIAALLEIADETSGGTLIMLGEHVGHRSNKALAHGPSPTVNKMAGVAHPPSEY